MLPSAERLRSNRQFQQVFAGGRSFAADGVLILYTLPAPDGQRQIGFTVSKKVGNAVVRNRVKRRLREAMRARLARLAPGHWLVVVARSRAAEVEFAALEGALERAIAKAGLRLAAQEG